MPAKSTGKIECLNPNTGGKMNIDAEVYDLFSKTIYHTLKKKQSGFNIHRYCQRCETVFQGRANHF